MNGSVETFQTLQQNVGIFRINFDNYSFLDIATYRPSLDAKCVMARNH